MTLIDRARMREMLIWRFNVPLERVSDVAAAIPLHGKWADGTHEIRLTDIEAVGRYKLRRENGVRRATCTDTGADLEVKSLSEES